MNPCKLLIPSHPTPCARMQIGKVRGLTMDTSSSKADLKPCACMQIGKVRGLTIDTSSSKALAESLDRAVSAEDPYFNKLFRIFATRCMSQAKYFSSSQFAPSEFLHYGLAAPIYTHFTSPIRRYADVLVHRCAPPVVWSCKEHPQANLHALYEPHPALR